MAKIGSASDEKIFQIKGWTGLNENPDGDTKLKLGEAAAMRNFRITRDGNLQRRPGSRMLFGLAGRYTLHEEPGAGYTRQDTGVSSVLTLYPGAEAKEDGSVGMTGKAETVDARTAAAHVGWYWQRGQYRVYRLLGHEADENGGIWRFALVRAVPAGDTPPVRGLWSGNVSGKEQLLAACGGTLWKLWDADTGTFIRTPLGAVDTSGSVSFFGFDGIVYLLNGKEYKQFDGKTLKDVEGYRPLVTIAVPPAGGGETLEQVNKLSGARRCWVSPDGSARTFTLPEKGLASLDYVKDLQTGLNMAKSAYSADLTAGTVTFTAAPARAVNSLEIGWTMKENFRAQIQAMRFSELYAGTQDSRVFLYGDGSNKAFYSGLDYDGNPRADYFPDLNEVTVGDSNTPITGLIRHYSTLVCFKTDSAWAIQYGVVTLADSSLTPAFYVTPVNRIIGNAAMGQVRLVLNSPYTLFGGDLYEWRNTGSYAANLSVDERQARRVSDRIYASLAAYDPERCFCWDDNDAQEYYICCGGKALVCNYAANAWYAYDSFDAVCMVNFRGELYYGTGDGRLEHFSYQYRTDDGAAIDAYWESGSLSFGRDYMRKYSAMLWIGIKPESAGRLWVTVETDRKSRYSEKLTETSLASFANANFARWSFRTNRKPAMRRLKIKAKKFVFYKLVFRATDADATATVLAADMRIRFTGNAK